MIYLSALIRPLRHICRTNMPQWFNYIIEVNHSKKLYLTTKYESIEIKQFLFYWIFKEKPKGHQKSNGLEKQSKINEAKKTKKTWTPAHQKSLNHRKKPSVLKACKIDPGLKIIPSDK